MSDCIFCKIASGEIPVDKLIDDEDVVAFRDLNPQAPEHILIIPRQHLERLAHADESHSELIGKLILAANKLAKKLKLDESGYRLVINNGESAGQSVWHLHLHLLGGRDFNWPPG
ncbi:histidine triad nucleotide-binding protein [bacterium]|nr:histidine triad nucleotide-binding protein [bacterium]MBU1919837.1 histidine triad nucleotide-binding protein [bacterium]